MTTAAKAAPIAVASVPGAPPAVPLPKSLQTLRFLVRPVAFYERWRRELGETFEARLFGPGEIVFVSDPDSLKRLFAADRVNTIAGGRNIVLRPLLGRGSLLLQEGEKHMQRRKLMLPPFHGERMRAYEQTIAEATERAIADWPRGAEFALHPSMQAITLEVIVRAVFGIEDAARRTALSERLVAILAESASPAALGLVTPLTSWLPRYRRFARLSAEANAILTEEIAERRADPELGEREDILSMLVAAEFEDGSKMGDAELRDQLKTLLLAGHETTATALAWTFDLLLHRPEAHARLMAEIEAGEREYLDAVIEESLRIRPVVAFTGRELRQPMTLGGHELDTGTTVMAGIYLAHTRPDLFPEPYEFRPERFLDEGPETYSWIPFGGGTRRCIGAAFAQMEMRIVLETVLRSVALEAARPDPEPMARRNITLSPPDGVRVIAQPR